MATNVDTLNFHANGLENFFNELEGDVAALVTSSGVYKLDHTPTGAFTNATLVTEMEDAAVFVEDEGRAYVRDEEDQLIALYVKFEI
jgi:hypothetical protein